MQELFDEQIWQFGSQELSGVSSVADELGGRLGGKELLGGELLEGLDEPPPEFFSSGALSAGAVPLDAESFAGEELLIGTVSLIVLDSLAAEVSLVGVVSLIVADSLVVGVVL